MIANTLLIIATVAVVAIHIACLVRESRLPRRTGFEVHNDD
jgi:hypothetical protein